MGTQGMWSITTPPRWPVGSQSWRGTQKQLAAMSDRAREIAGDNDWEHVAEQVENIYQTVI